MSNLAGKIFTAWEIMQCFQALDTISARNSCSRFGLYSDLCVQTVRRALSSLLGTFEKELRTLTKAGIHVCWTLTWQINVSFLINMLLFFSSSSSFLQS